MREDLLPAFVANSILYVYKLAQNDSPNED